MKRNLPEEKTFRLLLVEDDAQACAAMKETLERAGYAVAALNCGDDAFDEIRATHPDLVILDLDLPDITGWEILRLIRSDSAYFSIPVITVSGKYVQQMHAVRALSDFGSDDFIAKPFNKEILLSRIKALLRRKTWDAENESRVVKNGPIKLDMASREMSVRGRPVHLTNAEFKILFELVRNKGVPLNRSYLTERILGYSSPLSETRSVDKHIESLRRKLHEYSCKLITVRDIGYKFFILVLLAVACACPAGADLRGWSEKTGALVSAMEKDPQDVSKAELLDAAIRELIDAAAGKNKKEAARVMKSALQKTNGMFVKAVSDYCGKRYLSASDGFKGLLAYMPADRRATGYMYKIYSEMNTLANCDVAADAEKLAYAKGFIYYTSGEFINAVSEWERVLNINPSNPEVKQYLEKTRGYLKELIERERIRRLRDMARTVYDRAAADFNTGNYERAIEKWEKVVLISDKEKSGYFGELGGQARKQISAAFSKISGRTRSAKAEKTACPAPGRDCEKPEKDIAISDKYYREGLELYSLGRLRDAVTRWDLAIRFNPANSKAVKARENASREAGIE